MLPRLVAWLLAVAACGALVAPSIGPLAAPPAVADDVTDRQPFDTLTERSGPAGRPAIGTNPWEWSLQPPTWRPGDTWEYRYSGPSGSGQLTSKVIEERLIDGERHYVVSSHLRTLLYRARDLAHTATLEDGRPPVWYRPPLERFAWPLKSGVAWTTSSNLDIPDRTHVREYQCLATPAIIDIPLGRVATIRIRCRLVQWGERAANELEVEQWYSPVARNLVRHRLHRRDGTMTEHVLVDFTPAVDASR